MRLKQPVVLAFFVFISLAAGFVGSFAVSGSVETWYATLVHPFWAPPNWVFAPVWTLLYILMGTAAYLVSQSKRLRKSLVLWLFLAHLLVNAFWTIAFFGMHEILLSVLVIILLLGLIVLLMTLFWRYSHIATYLLVPYLLWTAFATTLALGFLALN